MTSPLNFDKMFSGCLDFNGRGPETVELWEKKMLVKEEVSKYCRPSSLDERMIHVMRKTFGKSLLKRWAWCLWRCLRWHP